MEISFIFPLYNEERRAKLMMPFLNFLERNFKTDKLQLVFLLNGCSDNTENEIKKLLKENKISRIFINSISRNRGSGIKKAIEIHARSTSKNLFIK